VTRPIRIISVFAAVAFMLAVDVASVMAQPGAFTLAVRTGGPFSGSRGTLTFDADGVSYHTDRQDRQRSWRYPDLQQLQIVGPTRVTLLTYEDQGGLRFGADRAYTFEVTGAPISGDNVAYLLERLSRPVVTAVLPASDSVPRHAVPVKHAQRRGSNGILTLRDDALVYATEAEGQSRFWRWTDIFAVLQIDRFRLEVVAYEGGGGDTRRYTFDLKRELPDGFYTTLWSRLNAPAPWVASTGGPTAHP